MNRLSLLILLLSLSLPASANDALKPFFSRSFMFQTQTGFGPELEMTHLFAVEPLQVPTPSDGGFPLVRVDGRFAPVFLDHGQAGFRPFHSGQLRIAQSGPSLLEFVFAYGSVRLNSVDPEIIVAALVLEISIRDLNLLLTHQRAWIQGEIKFLSRPDLNAPLLELLPVPALETANRISGLGLEESAALVRFYDQFASGKVSPTLRITATTLDEADAAILNLYFGQSLEN
jgi:hypothetical protein